VWALADEAITEHLCMNEDPNPKQWLFAMMESLSRDDFARVAVTLWAIWFARRKIIHEEEFQSPLSTHMFIQSYLRDLSISSKEGQKKVSTGSISHAPKWIPPLTGYAKINVDAAMSKTSRGGAGGVVCRSANGDFLGASTLTVSGIIDPTTMEVVACREAMALAKDLQLQRVTVASDCLSVINAINSEGFKGSYSMILDEVKADARHLQECSFRHESRLSNFESHRLARFAVSSNLGRQVWLLQLPVGLFILNNVLDD
jgi:ribonuclease HI